MPGGVAHNLTFDYFGLLGKTYLERMLPAHLEGKPDTPAWRQLFIDCLSDPVPYKGRIFARWALLDLYELLELRPALQSTLVPCGMSLEDFPPLGMVVQARKPTPPAP